MFKRPSKYEIRRSNRQFDPRLLRARSIPFEQRHLNRRFLRFVELVIFPDIERTKGPKHRHNKLNYLAQALAALWEADRAGKVLASPRGEGGLRVEMFDELCWHGYARRAIGNRRDGRASVYALRQRARDVLKDFETWREVFDPLRERTVVLKNRDGRQVKLPNATPYIVRDCGRRIAELNRVNMRDRDWRYTDKHGRDRRAMPCVRAIYRPDFHHGGRMHSWGTDGYQSLKKSVRATMTIDGEPTGEVDISGYLPRMLYHLCERDERGDVYNAKAVFPAIYETHFFGDDRRLNGFDEEQVRDAARRIVKTSLQILLSTRCKPHKGRTADAGETGATSAVCGRCERSALQAIRAMVNGWRKRSGQRKRSNRRARLYQTVVFAICGTDAEGIVAAIKRVHAPIAHYFYKGKAREIEAIVDGPMMLEILERLQRDGIPALGIHDAVLCRRRDLDAVEAVMRHRYALRFAFPPVLKRK